jgi:flagellar capping protein FliD
VSLTIGNLDSYFANIVNSVMSVETQALTRLKIQRDGANLRKTTYTGLQTKLESLHDSVKGMLSTDAFYDLEINRSTEITSLDQDKTVLAASADSGAVSGEYEFDVTSLAAAQRRASAVQSTIDQALNLSGDFWLGGTGSASAVVTPDSNITAAGTAAVTEDLDELGTLEYAVEVRDEDGVLQFRIKDIDNKIVAIQDQDGDAGDVTTQWQTLNAGAYDTGRGLTLTFGASAAAGSTSVDYTAAGTSVAITTDDTLIDIANAINSADQPAGRDLAATIIGNQLILTAANTGTAHTMIYDDQVGLGFTGSNLTDPADAAFSVNNIDFTRSFNKGLEDVINDVSLDLYADAEGQAAILEISPDTTEAMTKIENFIEQFNDIQTFLEEKTATIAQENGGTTTYQRGVLANDSIFNSLRGELFSLIISNAENSGAFDNLREVGITINDSLRASIDDSATLKETLVENMDDLTSLLDGVMSEFDSVLDRFTNMSDGYFINSMRNYDNQLKDFNDSIDQEETRLELRQQSLVDEYAAIQGQLLTMTYTSQQMSALYGSFRGFG